MSVYLSSLDFCVSFFDVENTYVESFDYIFTMHLHVIVI